MNLDALLMDFRRRGLRVWPEGGKLVVAPADLLTDADREAIREAKAELLRLLSRDSESPLPIDLSAIAGAIARVPRSPFLNDLAIATIAKAAIHVQSIMTALTPAGRSAALTRCRELQDQIVAAIERRDYRDAYEIAARLDRLPHEIGEMRPQ